MDRLIKLWLITGLLCAPVAAQEKQETNKTMNTDKQGDIPIACNLKALDAAQRQRHQEVTRQLLAAVQERRELPDGYAFRLPSETPALLMVAEFVSRERLCCPFFKFQIEVESDAAPVWLRITGKEGVKQFLQSQFN